MYISCTYIIYIRGKGGAFRVGLSIIDFIIFTYFVFYNTEVLYMYMYICTYSLRYLCIIAFFTHHVLIW